MRKKREERDKKIRQQIKMLQNLGIRLKSAYEIIADKYYLSAARVQDIWYGKK